MIYLTSWAYFTFELLTYMINLWVIWYLMSKRYPSVIAIFIILAVPISLLSMDSRLLGLLSVMITFSLLRIREWRRSISMRYEELMRLFLAFLIDIVTSLILTNIIPSAMGITNNQTLSSELSWKVVFVYCASLAVIEISIAIILKRLLAKLLPSESENKILAVNFLFFVLSTSFIVELFRQLEVYGRYSLLVMAYLIIQLIFVTYQAINAIRTNRKVLEARQIENELSAMMAYTKELENNYNELRTFKHDYRNMMLGFQAKYPFLKEESYFKEALNLPDTLVTTGVGRFTDLKNITSPGIKALIVSKLTVAQVKGIQVVFGCRSLFHLTTLSEFDLVRILGILMDNGIEASAHSTKKYLKLIIDANETETSITIENSYDGQRPDLQRIKKAGFSTKGENRGLGLANLSTILEGNPRSQVFFSLDSGNFTVTLVIRGEE